MLSLPPLNSASWCDDQKCSWTFNTWSVSLDCVWPLTSRKPMFSFNGWMLSSGCLICGASKDQWMSNFWCLVVVTYVQWSRKLIYRKLIFRSGLYQIFSARQSNVNYWIPVVRRSLHVLVAVGSVNEKTLFHGTGKHAPEKIVLQREGFMLDYGWYSNVHLVILQSLFVFASTKLSLPPCPIPFPHAYTVFAFSWPRIRAVHLLIFCRSWECVTMWGFLCSSFLPPPLYVVPLLRFLAVSLACFLATLLVILHFYLLLAQHAHCHDHRKYQLIYGPSIKFLIHLFEWQLFHEWRTCQLNHWRACFIHLRFVCMNHSYLRNCFATNNVSHNGSSRLLGNTGELEFHTRGWPPPACRRSGFICLNLFWLNDFERIKKPFRRYDFQLLCHYSMLMSPRTEVVVLLDKNTALFIFSIGCLWESWCI